ncbi:P-loop containing nucleoside triphosphate hydrolase protein [Delitschia confertaspora ATCC 74209]|uniref:P-loop containing nucleoside triphosphate hydrolase protein n=1 Tax=Delitschia confertaspora ATCC 74209 TaxID=1513339 RepID=A0A9P4MU49_9PLEO|nr:P-loop containing nucleoside triphosphate hydrolase protein [Delitschia confertaspora ATCC 74209]
MNFHSTRIWRPVGDRLEKKRHAGNLTDNHRFAKYSYSWDRRAYTVYEVTWYDTFSSPSEYFYIVHPRTDVNIHSGHCLDTDALVLAAGKWTSELHEEIFVFDQGYWGKSKDLWKAIQGSSWEDVIIDPSMKKNIIEDVQGFFDSQQLYDEFAVPWKRGIIIHGLPGNGKTVSIKALINSLYARTPDPMPSLYVKSFETCSGDVQFSIRQVFQKARASAPCLLIFKDLDSLIKDEVRSYFLNEVDGLESNDGILMIGSTNHLDRLDPAISKRPSRFDRKYHFKLPDEEQREAYAHYWRKKLVGNRTMEFPDEVAGLIAKVTEGFSFAYLKELFVMSLLTVARGGVALNDFEVGDEDGDTEEEGEGEKVKETKKQPPRKMPTIDIPDHLAENILLKVIKHHTQLLLSEMDNSKEVDWSTGKKSMGQKKRNRGMASRMAQSTRAMDCS